MRYDKLKKPYSHEIIGPLTQGVGVCEGIAKSVKALCDTLGIWCIIAVSEANPEKHIKYRHAWNVIRIDGNYYHLDVTFDNSLGKCGYARYDYVNLNDKQIFRDHEPMIWKVPVCEDGDHTYYREKKVSFTKMEEAAQKEKHAYLSLNWPQAVMLVEFRDGQAVEQIVLEESNEGESFASSDS